MKENFLIALCCVTPPQQPVWAQRWWAAQGQSPRNIHPVVSAVVSPLRAVAPLCLWSSCNFFLCVSNLGTHHLESYLALTWFTKRLKAPLSLLLFITTEFASLSLMGLIVRVPHVYANFIWCNTIHAPLHLQKVCAICTVQWNHMEML